MAKFNNFADVSEWVDVHGIEALRDALLPGGRFGMPSREVAGAWLRQQVEDGKVAREDEVHSLLRRQTKASERAVIVAWSALAVSILALVATAWPYLPWLKK